MGDIKNFSAARVAKELKDGDVVNLGIGLPTLVPNHLPEGVDLTLQSENGFVGLVPLEEGRESPHIVNAGGAMAGIADDGAFFSSADSFAIIRGGHVDVTVFKWMRKETLLIIRYRAKCFLVWAVPWTWLWGQRKLLWLWNIPIKANTRSLKNVHCL